MIVCGGEGGERDRGRERRVAQGAPPLPPPESLALPEWSLPVTAIPGYSPAPAPTPSSGHAPTSPAPSASSQPFWRDVATVGTNPGDKTRNSFLPWPPLASHMHGGSTAQGGHDYFRGCETADTADQFASGSAPESSHWLGSFGDKPPGAWRDSLPVSPTQIVKCGKQAVVGAPRPP